MARSWLVAALALAQAACHAHGLDATSSPATSAVSSPAHAGQPPAPAPSKAAEASSGPAADTEPAVVAYSPPQLEDVRVRRHGRRVRIFLHWHPVPGARAYDVQLSRTAIFGHVVAAAKPSRPRCRMGWLRPGFYFARARATGPLGEGAYSGVQLVDATRSALRHHRRRRPASPSSSPAVPTGAPTASTPALDVQWNTPADHSLSTAAVVQARGRCTPGASLQLDGAPRQPCPAGTFALPLTLRPGQNQVVLVATLGASQRRLVRRIDYADPARLAQVRGRFAALRRQLDAIHGLRRQLVAAAASLRQRLHDAGGDAAQLAELQQQLTSIQQNRRDIDAQIDAALSQIDTLLAGAHSR